jgi:hypothetical protein
MARPPQHRKTSPTPTPSLQPIDNIAATPVAGPVFAQPKPTADRYVSVSTSLPTTPPTRRAERPG